jgi:low temperature requirement protein LtrA
VADEPASSGEHGKRVSWVELYLDLIFVLAVGQLSHLIVHEPEMASVWTALGLFMTIWWTWIGFAVLYNRRGEIDKSLRLLFLAASVPAGVAAVAIEPASVGESGVFAASLAVVRVILALCAIDDNELGKRTAASYVVSAAVFVVSIIVPAPVRYVLWALAIAGESGQLLHSDREAANRARERHDFAEFKPKDPREALDAHHFAERFGLFLIILLGEVLVEASQASTAGETIGAQQWWGLIAAMVLAASLWWLYFDAAADLNLRVLELSGGSPTMARTIFAVGHMVPCFALLVISAGVGLLLEEDPPGLAYWLACLGLGAYLLSTRVFLAARTLPGHAVRLVLLIAIFGLGRWRDDMTAHHYVWLLAAIGVVCAAFSSRGPRHEAFERLEQAG